MFAADAAYLVEVDTARAVRGSTDTDECTSVNDAAAALAIALREAADVLYASRRAAYDVYNATLREISRKEVSAREEPHANIQ